MGSFYSPRQPHSSCYFHLKEVENLLFAGALDRVLMHYLQDLIASFLLGSAQTAMCRFPVK
jgi:hypothetical protein